MLFHGQYTSDGGVIEWSQDGQTHTLRREDVGKLLDRRRHRRRPEELLLLEDAKKLLGVTYGYLYVSCFSRNWKIVS
jgi:hypothetical protein